MKNIIIRSYHLERNTVMDHVDSKYITFQKQFFYPLPHTSYNRKYIESLENAYNT